MVNVSFSGVTAYLEEGGLKVVADLKEEMGWTIEKVAVTANANPLKRLLRGGRRCLKVCNQKSSEF